VRRLRRALLGLIALAVVAFVLLATAVDVPGGPLDEPSGGGVGFTRAKVGDVMTFQSPLIRNPTGRTIRLRKVEPEDVDPGLEVVGIRIVPQQLDEAVMEPGWPPPKSAGQVFDVEGFELPSRGTGVVTAPVLLIGVRFTQLGRHRLTGFRLHYRDRLLRRSSTMTGFIELSDH